MSSFREQLKQGLFSSDITVSKPYSNKKIHKRPASCTITAEGFCEFDFSKEENFFLLKASRNDSKRCKGIVR